MISEERFKQLADEKATVYWVYKDYIDVITAYLSDADWFGYENVFETEEEAKEYLKYGNITRTEKFPYISWEELNKDFQNFKNGTYIVAKYQYLFSLNIEVNKPIISQIILVTNDEDYKWNYSKENYHKALDLAVKLFKGEEV